MAPAPLVGFLASPRRYGGTVAFFELVNLTSGTRVAAYRTREEAVCDARSMLRRDGEHALDQLALGFEDDDGRRHIVVRGDALADLVEHTNCGA